MQRTGVFNLGSLIERSAASPLDLVNSYYDKQRVRAVVSLTDSDVIIPSDHLKDQHEFVQFYLFNHNQTRGMLSITEGNLIHTDDLISRSSVFFIDRDGNLVFFMDRPRRLTEVKAKNFMNRSVYDGMSPGSELRKLLGQAKESGFTTSNTTIWFRVPRELAFVERTISSIPHPIDPPPEPAKKTYTTYTIREITDPQYMDSPGFPSARFDDVITYQFFYTSYEKDPNGRFKLRPNGQKIPIVKAKPEAEDMALRKGIPIYAYDMTDVGGQKGFFIANDAALEALYASPNAFVKMRKFENAKSVRCLNEVLTWLWPTKPFFDFDLYIDANPEFADKDKADKLTWACIDYINRAFYTFCGVSGIDRSLWTILSSDREEKCSRHAMCHDERVMFRSVQCYEYFVTLLKCQIRQGWTENDPETLIFKVFDKKKEHPTNFMDESVISRFRSFRMYGMCKMERNVPLKYHQGVRDRLRPCLTYLIQRPYSGTFANIDKYLSFKLDGSLNGGSFYAKYNEKDEIVQYFRKSDKKRKLQQKEACGARDGYEPFTQTFLRKRNADGMVSGLNKEQSEVLHRWLDNHKDAEPWVEDDLLDGARVKWNSEGMMIDFDPGHTFCYILNRLGKSPYHERSVTFIMILRDEKRRNRYYALQSCWNPECGANEPGTKERKKRHYMGSMPDYFIETFFTNK
jgi:hypothetical protein